MRNRLEHGCAARGGIALGLLITFVATLPVLGQDEGGLAGGAVGSSSREFFFEPPRLMSPGAARYPALKAGAWGVALAYQEEVTTETGGNVYLTVARSTDGGSWSVNRRVLGPFAYRGSAVPPFYDLQVDHTGIAWVAVAESATNTRILRFDRDGSYRETARLETATTTVAPRLFVDERGRLSLYLVQNVAGLLTIVHATSDDGTRWSGFESLVERNDLPLNLTPTIASYRGTYYLVFQSLDPARRSTFQLFLSRSTDAGADWDDPIRLTDFFDVERAASADSHDNQRPFLHVHDDRLFLAWERRLQTGNPQIFVAELDSAGALVGEPVAVTSRLSAAADPSLFTIDGRLYVAWFTSPVGNSQVVFAEVPRLGRDTLRDSADSADAPAAGTTTTPNDTASVESPAAVTPLTPSSQTSRFPEFAVINGQLHTVWQRRTQDGSPRVYYLEPDQRSTPPALEPANFATHARTKNTVADIRWQIPQDTAGIAGYSYTWSRDRTEVPPREVTLSTDVGSLRLPTEEDGAWYFRIRSTDRAGNWSDPAEAVFLRDTSPPDAVSFVQPPLDEDGYLTSNTFVVRWSPGSPSDTVGYTYSLDRLGVPRSVVNEGSLPQPNLVADVLVRDPYIETENLDDGLYALTVSAIDQVGNVGPSNRLLLRANKYVPVTIVRNVEVDVDPIGRLTLAIGGRGFSANGAVSRIVLDRNAEPPYDYDFRLNQGDYALRSDRAISSLLVDRVETGSYRIGLDHPERGITFTDDRFSLQERGLITFGDYTLRHRPTYRFQTVRWFSIPVGGIGLIAVLALAAIAIVFSTFRVRSIVVEARRITAEARRLMAAPGVEEQRELAEQVRRLKRHGVSLRVKFTLFVVVLVAGVVALVSLPLSNYTLANQQAVLARGLEDRVAVLLDSLSGSARQFLPTAVENQIDLALLPNQMEAMSEATYVTVTGAGQDDVTSLEYVWGTNDAVLRGEEDPAIDETDDDDDEAGGTDVRIRSLDPPDYLQGRSRITDAVSPILDELQARVNEEARDRLGDIPAQLAQLKAEEEELARVTEFTQEIIDRSVEVGEIQATLNQRLTEILTLIGREVYSYPSFDSDSFDPEQQDYIFYKPVLYATTGEPPESARYYRGTVRLGVSTVEIVRQIEDAQEAIIRNIAIFAAVALAAGIVGALILTSIIVIPINRLVRGVERIRDTEDKEALSDHVIQVRTRDEISTLAEAINQMTQGLVKAAAASKDLTVGKDVQKMFIPLETDATGAKLTTGAEETANVEFFGYYEGAKGVSGDYFDFEKIGPDKYAVIKCDVAGKGVPAALIMVEVATLFLEYFSNYQERKIQELRISQALKRPVNTEGELPPLIRNINDLLESRRFRGRFAAFTMAILDASDGELKLSNAGDKTVHMYSAAEGRMIQFELPEVPAAGVFHSSMMPMKHEEITRRLKSGDILLLFTDGVEEAKRLLRDTAYQHWVISQEDIDNGRAPQGVAVNVGDEEFSIERIHTLINAVQRKATFRLERLVERDAVPSLEFDFANCEGTARDVVMALVAVEKVFRLYRPPAAGVNSHITIDKKIDDFLREHFVQYDFYFTNMQPEAAESAYRTYTHVQEDDQYDDLTVLAIRKK